MTTRLLAVALFVAAVLMVSCSSSGEQTRNASPVTARTEEPLASTPVVTTTVNTPAASSSSGSTVIVTFPFTNAVQARESLLGTARFGAAMDPLDSSDPLDLKAYPGWASAYPALRLAGSSVNATPQSVSVYRGLLNPGAAASASNPKVIAFTVQDTKGDCTGGAIRGFPTYSLYTAIPIDGTACSAQSVLNVLRR